MKLILLISLFSSSLFADESNQYRFEEMSATGSREVSMGTLISPPGLGAQARAKWIAKTNLKEKCKRELNGKIVGEISVEITSFHSGDMTAHALAKGSCRY